MLYSIYVWTFVCAMRPTHHMELKDVKMCNPSTHGTRNPMSHLPKSPFFFGEKPRDQHVVLHILTHSIYVLVCVRGAWCLGSNVRIVLPLTYWMVKTSGTAAKTAKCKTKWPHGRMMSWLRLIRHIYIFRIQGFFTTKPEDSASALTEFYDDVFLPGKTSTSANTYMRHVSR